MRGVGWSDEKNISDLNYKSPIFNRSVFLAQSHLNCESELLGAMYMVCTPTLAGLCERTLSN